MSGFSNDYGVDGETFSGGTPDDADPPRPDHWITGLVDDLVDQLPEIQAEAEQAAQTEQHANAELQVLHDRISEIVEGHYERHMAGAVPVDFTDLLDQAQAEQQRLEAEVARLHRYERAVASLAAQICSPATTAEQMCCDILGEPAPGRRASR